MPAAGGITYGQTLNDSTLIGGEATLNRANVPGSFAWDNSSISPAVSDSNKTEYTVKFTPSDTANYNEATCKVKVVASKAEIPSESITAPVAKAGLTYTGSEQELVNAGSATGGTMYYAVTTETRLRRMMTFIPHPSLQELTPEPKSQLATARG